MRHYSRAVTCIRTSAILILLAALLDRGQDSDQRCVNRTDDERNQDSIPLSPKGSQWSYPDPVRSAEERGAESTNHIDRHREAYHHNITKTRLLTFH